MSPASSSAPPPSWLPLFTPAELGRLARAAESEAPILILGQPGTGRSSLARWLHARSRRAGRLLVEVDAVALPASLFEAELFGYRAGAFTGAEASLDGRVARAQGGSLLLDRLESLPLPVQPKLLRLLAEGRYSPLGGREREADVRFLAIADEDLSLRVERGTFRSDLYYRLEVLTFRLPPLAERKARLAEVVASLLEDLGARLGERPPELDPAAWTWMERYGWPGNLRQLRNVLERALILQPGAPLAPPPPVDLAGERPRPLAELEESEIRRALAYTRGHQAEAAALLGISRKSLWERRRRYGIA
ncbi:MAG: sigma 54-interacting transcriptional regulator [Thermoanaerobaculia bacterium]